MVVRIGLLSVGTTMKVGSIYQLFNVYKLNNLIEHELDFNLTINHLNHHFNFHHYFS